MFLERFVKFILWSRGGWRIYLDGPAALAERLAALAGEEYRIIHSDRRSFLVLAAAELAGARVGGSGALAIDATASLYGSFPLMLAVVALVTFVLLARAFRSLLLAFKAIVLNLLSIGAAYGVLVLVWQEGHGSEAIWGIPATGAVAMWVPLMAFAFLYGLSMDYEVFLLSRIKEAWDQTGDNDLAVALGLQRTGRIVTSAAALIVVVFLGFAAGELLTIKEVGLGMAIAVVLDATVVRMLLVPATMKLMGRWNWWAPPALRRLHDRWGLVERGPAAAPARPDDQERVGSLHAGP
jgi:RND superfamily putative drug exporter